MNAECTEGRKQAVSFTHAEKVEDSVFLKLQDSGKRIHLEYIMTLLFLFFKKTAF